MLDILPIIPSNIIHIKRIIHCINNTVCKHCNTIKNVNDTNHANHTNHINRINNASSVLENDVIYNIFKEFMNEHFSTFREFKDMVKKNNDKNNHIDKIENTEKINKIYHNKINKSEELIQSNKTRVKSNGKRKSDDIHRINEELRMFTNTKTNTNTNTNTYTNTNTNTKIKSKSKPEKSIDDIYLIPKSKTNNSKNIHSKYKH